MVYILGMDLTNVFITHDDVFLVADLKKNIRKYKKIKSLIFSNILLIF